MKLNNYFIKASLLAALSVLIFATGCQKPDLPPEIDRYELYNPANVTTIKQWSEDFYVYEDEEIKITIGLFEHAGLVVVPLEIKNKTGVDIKPEHYSIELTDGRDHMPVKMMTRQELEMIKQKMVSKGSFNLLDTSIQGAMTAVTSLMSYPVSSELIKQLQFAIDHYFAMRPIYAESSRQGFLTFYHDFTLELPLLFQINLPDQELKFYFKPISAKQK